MLALGGSEGLVTRVLGEIAATLLSRFAVPVLYHRFVGRARARKLLPAAGLAERVVRVPVRP